MQGEWFIGTEVLISRCIAALQNQEETKIRQFMGEQETGSAIYNIVAFYFDGQKTAKQIFKEAKEVNHG